MQKMLLPPMQDGTPSNTNGFLTEIIQEFKQNDITNLGVFRPQRSNKLKGAKAIGADRIEFYTEAFAHQFSLGNKECNVSLIQSVQNVLCNLI